MSFANIVTEGMVLVVNTATGEDIKIFKGDSGFKRALELIQEGKYADVFKLDIKNVITSFFKENDDSKSVTIKIDGGVGKLVLHEFSDMEVELSDAITQKILKMNAQGFTCKPLANFLANLYKNPSPVAISELYLFIEACELPITEDGEFIAYKIVRDDYKDIYTGKMDNSVGQVVQMPRGLVDDNRNNTCSRGLHFCSKDYLAHYGSGGRGNDRCLLVKINPADVVSIPSDYNNAKGRAWRYEVVGEVAKDWRATLPRQDYTDRAVVGTMGQALTVARGTEVTTLPKTLPVKNLKTEADVIKIVNDSRFYFSTVKKQWFEGSVAVGRRHVKDSLSVEYEDLDTYQDYLSNQW